MIGEEVEISATSKVALPQLISRAEPSPAEFASMFEDISARIQEGEFKKSCR